MKRKYRIINHRNAALLALALGTGSALAVDGTWNNNSSANWGDTTRWLSGTVADGVGATATISAAFSANRTITLDTSRTIGILNLNATSRNTTVNASGGSVLILDNTLSTNAQINVPVGPNQNELIDAPIQLQDSLTITNSIPAGNKSLSLGAISSTNGALTITNTSAIHATVTSTRFNGVISDGTSGNSVSLNNLAGLAGISNASNTFSGSTTVTGGVLRIEHATALQNSPLNTTGSIAGDANNGFRINTGVTTLTLGGLAGNKNLAATGGVITTNAGGYNQITALTLNPGTGKSHSYDGAIEDGAVGMTLTKTGGGIQTLGGTSTYTGDTLVSAGTLLINGSLSSSTNDVTVGADGIIGGDGSIAGTLNFASGADFVFSTTMTLDVTGGTTFAGSFGIADLVGLDSSVAVGTYTLINGGTVDFTNVINVGAGNAVSLGGGKSAYLQSGSLQVVVAAIPEPSAALLGGLGFLGLLRRRRN